MTASRTELDKLVDMIRAKYGVIGIRTVEERRAKDLIADLRDRYPSIREQVSGVQTWSLAEGWMSKGENIVGPSATTIRVPDTQQDPFDALQWVKNRETGMRHIFIFCDVDEYLDGLQGEKKSKVIRQLREVVDAFKNTNNTLILLGASLRFDGALGAEIPILDLPLPTSEDLRKLVEILYKAWKRPNQNTGLVWNEDLMRRLVMACQGMTWQDAEDAVTLANLACGGYCEKMIAMVHEVKQDRVKSVRGLEVIDVTKSMADVGGLDVLQEWVEMRRDMFTEGARDFGVDPAKGIMTVGVPGGGKSLSARALAGALNLPLLRVNVAGLYDKYVGNTEENVARMLRSLAAASPCVAWFDEAEKAFATGTGDGNTSQRLLGQFLSWMEDRAGGVVCYFTANQVENLPPELMRMGRLDERFFVGLPGHQGREDIWKIQLRAKKRSPDRFNIKALALATRGWTGAEIRTCIQNTLVRTYRINGGKCDITTDELVDESTRMTPLSVSQYDKLERMVRWATENKIVQAASATMQAELDGLPTVDFGSRGRWPGG